MISPDGKYLYFTTGGVVPKAEHIRFSDQQLETIVSLKDFQSCAELWNRNRRAGRLSCLHPRHGYQEIYALNIRWP
jgi:hypothetical protein